MISTLIYVVRHGHVADHQGDVAILPAGKRAAFDAGARLADHLRDGGTATILHAPTARTRETAEELARGLELTARAQNKNAARIFAPRVENAIRNFQFIIGGRDFPPTDAMHESLPASAECDPFLNGFWQATDDPIAYWLTHPSASAEAPALVAERLREFFVATLARAPGFCVVITHSGPMRAFLRESLGADPGEPDFCEAFLVRADGVRYRDQHGKLQI
ncbi:MAG: histidine phosphatase family protein [Chloroflexi bacterium]|nr:histidine phosphatase family protein [Chloroflexota bacterium]